MNKFIAAVRDLDLVTIVEMVRKHPKWLNWSEPSGKNALHYLCGLAALDEKDSSTSLDILKMLLSAGTDINSVHRIEDKDCGHFPATPLWYAYTRGRNEKLWKYLLKQGADPNNCMWAIAWYDDVAAAKVFIKHGADLDPEPGKDALFVGAFAWNKMKFAKWLLSEGSDVNAGDPDGNTALIIAVRRKDEEALRMLVAGGADPDKKNSKGDSPRSIASTKGPKRLLALLDSR